MRKAFLILTFLNLILAVAAQNFEEYKRQQESEFNKYKNQKENEYKAYRDKMNKEYANYMRQHWTEFKVLPAIVEPDVPKPITPIKCKPNETPITAPIVINPIVVPAPPKAPSNPPQPAVPIPDVVVPEISPKKPEINPQQPTIPNQPTITLPKIEKPSFSFHFYGANYTATLGKEHHFSLFNIDENSVADAWNILSSEKYNPMLNECLKLRDQLKLCDWGYFRLTEELSTQFFHNDNQAKILQMYILTQSGYKVRIGRSAGNLVLLLPLNEIVYNFRYLNIDGVNYYIIKNKEEMNGCFVFQHKFPNEQNFSLLTSGKPALPMKRTEEKTFTSYRLNSEEITLSVNKNLIDFYNDFPRAKWNVHGVRSLSDDLKKELYPSLKKVLNGKSEAESANILINFVQFAFDYKTDPEQFGYERALFADETFFYPYSDCEDRSILYAILVRDLLGLEVVFLNYPRHIATAVKFNTAISGSYFQIDGSRYYVCDPTYIGASIGMAMPSLQNEAATVVFIE